MMLYIIPETIKIPHNFLKCRIMCKIISHVFLISTFWIVLKIYDHSKYINGKLFNLQ